MLRLPTAKQCRHGKTPAYLANRGGCQGILESGVGEAEPKGDNSLAGVEAVRAYTAKASVTP